MLVKTIQSYYSNDFDKEVHNFLQSLHKCTHEIVDVHYYFENVRLLSDDMVDHTTVIVYRYGGIIV